MSDVAERFQHVAGRFTATAQAVPDDGWDRPSPCAGWAARDIVRHLVAWVPPILGQGAGVDLSPGLSVDDDPVGAWMALDGGLQAVLGDPQVSSRQFTNEHTGTHPLDEAIAMFVLGDVLIHTWDLARATGLDETLDADEVHRMLLGVEPLGDVLSQSGHYDPPVPVPAGADEQTRLLAFTGRRP